MNNLKKIREKRKLSPKEAARILGVRIDLYLRLESGECDETPELSEIIPELEDQLKKGKKVDLPIFEEPIFLCPVIQKGGVGKTTSVIGIAGALAEKGFSVLIVDCTEQMDATMAFFSDEELGNAGTVLDAMQDMDDIRKYILNTANPLIDLVPGDYRIDRIDKALEDNVHKDSTLRVCFRDLVKDNYYDFVLIDTSNHMGSFADVIWMSNDRVYYYMVMGTQGFSASQCSRTLKEIDIKKEKMSKFGHEFECAGIFLNMVDMRTSSAREMINILENGMGDLYIKDYIHRDENINKSQVYKIPIVQYAHSSKAAKDFINVSDEIVRRIEVNERG